MRVRILLFASYRDLAGVEELLLELPAGSSAADAVGSLRSQSAQLARIPARPVVAVNREYAPIDTRLHADDEVALLPPVAGG